MSYQAAELRFYKTPEERKGLLLSHLIGIAILIEFVFNFVRAEIPFTPLISVPIRLIGIYLLLDRTGRVGRLRFGIWDWTMLGFVATTGIGLLITSVSSPELPSAFEDYRRFIGVILGMYLYYLVTKESLNRKGFRPDITIKWLLAAFAFSALLGLAQHFNVPGVRDLTLRLYRLYSDSEVSQGLDISLAWGTSVGWNMMAFEMLIAFSIVFGPTLYRKPKWWEVALGALYMGAFVSTESRGGLAAFGACAIGAVIFLLANRRPKKAIVVASVVGSLVLIWLVVVFTFKIERFTVTLKGEQVRSSADLASIDYRIEQQYKTFNVGAQRPLFGTGPNSLLFPGDRPRVLYYSTSSVMGTVDGMYGLIFAQFGLMGIAFLVLVIIQMLRFISPQLAFRPYAFTIFLIGIAFATHGLVEFILYARAWVVINTVMALASSRFLASESGRVLPVRAVPMQEPLRPAKELANR